MPHEPRPLPLARALFWNPVSAGNRRAESGGFPIFFAQEAIQALLDHVRSQPDAALLGFLTGKTCEDPATHQPFIIIDSTLRLNQPVYGDKTTIVVERLWNRVQDQILKNRTSLLGWYHTHPPLEVALSTLDIETHRKFFTQPWQVAVVAGTEAGEPAGG
ncbi:MAG TPA: hypothetical protein VFK78_09975, partial [Gemmatimonadales bacterium]|nr:hypothetical protein [Gemmatimonadales bacterium]